ncbi:NAD-dependent epimerase/dehydratase family protein [Kineococcus sp. SYSU DK003]|uniref:NAD-dependent epimerase/dehydratase family protein n=1 Tax=Kineococcus sp. SYSU DK003 TaxID=3383124 RepID=UPI003D7DCFCF
MERARERSGEQVHVVVGAAGATGHRVVRELLSAGHLVRAVTRDGRSLPVRARSAGRLELVAADAADGTGLARACRGAHAVHLCAMPPLPSWRRDFPPMLDAATTAASRAGARLVSADDTWLYGKVDGPMTETTPYRPVSAHGVLRAWLAERLLAAAARREVAVSIERAGELYGPGVRSMIAGHVFGAASRGRRVHRAPCAPAAGS